MSPKEAALLLCLGQKGARQDASCPGEPCCPVPLTPPPRTSQRVPPSAQRGALKPGEVKDQAREWKWKGTGTMHPLIP